MPQRTLASLLTEEIAAQGPMPVSRFMELALAHPEFGYYAKGDPLGARGDFITAPEISQMFGELLGAWAGDIAERMDFPDDLRFVELGPGRGTLMADALRVLQPIPEFEPDVHFVELNETLKTAQAEQVPDAHWHASIDHLPEGPAILIANEFFDALPITQFLKMADGWHELLVETAENGFERITGPKSEMAAELIPARLKDAAKGKIFEVSLAARQIVHRLSARLRERGGALLIIDYGPGQSGTGDTLQALAGHESADPFARPGEIDLTAHVDFESLAREARAAGAQVWGPVPQGVFLTRLGLAVRATALKRRATPEQAKAIDQAQYRLSAPDQMGTLFKVMAITSPNCPPPAGFET